LAIYRHTDNSYWFGSGYQGITRLRNGVYTNFNEAGGLPDNHCNTFYAVDEHTVFACTEKGVVVLDPLAANPVKAHYGFAEAYNRQPKLLGVVEPQKGVYIFYSNGGLFRLQNGLLKQEKIDGLPAQNILFTRMATDNRKRVWMATQGKGLLQCRYNGKGLTLERHYTKTDGLLSNEILSVLVDKNDNLWIADYTSLSMMRDNAGQPAFVNFTAADGLPSDYYQHLHLVQQNAGTIWVLTSMNLFSFHPDSLQLNTLPPRLFFDSVHLQNERRIASSGKDEWQVAHHQNNPAFYFTAVSLSDPSKIKYAYRLLPGDTTWVQISERSLRFSSLNPASYTLELKAANNNGQWSKAVRWSFQIKPPFWNTWWFYFLAATAVLLVFYALFRRRIKAVKYKAALHQQVTELESRALRAQMNPHFIFNSLNAIQELIVTRNVEAAYDYLSRFSKLLRLVLNNSEKPLIPLADEAAMLHLYLELESLRFRQSFSYRITVDDAIDTETVLVPPLLLQPFIENAVWHGLMLKEGKKELAVRIEASSSMILCTVEDNGIGRKRAAEIKAQKLGAGHFESKGLALSRQRIQLLENRGKRGDVKIEDLYSDGIAPGTRVSIYLPLTQA
ncbi:MAG TPA: histidine kinase, partial [Flavisolibacter sp.]|nr:histidine kinase [Flavisolibacter sp.]